MVNLETDCPYCGATVARFWPACPYCGSVHLWLEEPPSNSTRQNSSNEIAPTHQVIEIDVKRDGILSFSIRDDSPGIPWWFDLDLDGEQLYRICNGCDTCSAIFERVRDATLPVSPERLSEMFVHGLKFIPKEVVEAVSFLLPEGKYIVGLLRLAPKFRLKWGTEYIWSGKEQEYAKQASFEVVLPIVPEKALDQDRIKYYESILTGGEEPTVLALSLVIEKFPMGTYRQWSLSHFLLDGHHKMMAASNTSKPLTMLSFLHIDHPSPTLGLGEEDIRRYYAGGELNLGLLRNKIYDPIYDRGSYARKAKFFPEKGFARLLAIILTLLLGGLVMLFVSRFI